MPTAPDQPPQADAPPGGDPAAFARSTRDPGDLDPIDQEWLRRRSAAGPLAFGVIGLVTSPLILGLAFGALGMRAGIDLWRHGTRRSIVALGIGASFAAVVLSIMGALLWGSVLTTVLLGRDAIRETERWRGRTVEPVEVATLSPDGGAATIPLRATGGAPRIAMLFVRVDSTASSEAIRTLVDALGRHPAVPALLVDPFAPAEDVRAFARGSGLAAAAVGAGTPLPPPLDGVAAFPTLVVIDASGRIESAIVGARTPADLDLLLGGAAADPPPAR